MPRTWLYPGFGRGQRGLRLFRGPGVGHHVRIAFQNVVQDVAGLAAVLEEMVDQVVIGIDRVLARRGEREAVLVAEHAGSSFSCRSRRPAP
jgi:hypothetical protein